MTRLVDDGGCDNNKQKTNRLITPRLNNTETELLLDFSVGVKKKKSRSPSKTEKILCFLISECCFFLMKHILN